MSSWLWLGIELAVDAREQHYTNENWGAENVKGTLIAALNLEDQSTIVNHEIDSDLRDAFDMDLG